MAKTINPQWFKCDAGCKRESLLPLVEMGKRCFKHGRPYYHSPSETMYQESQAVMDERILDSILEGI